MVDVIPVTQARRDLLKLVDKVEKENSYVYITKHGRAKVVLISPKYLNALEEKVFDRKHILKTLR